MRKVALLLSSILIASSCSSGTTGDDTRPTGPPSTVNAESTTTTRDPRPCSATTVLTPLASADGTPAVERLPSGNPHAAAVAASKAMFDCAIDVVVVDTADVNRIALAAVLAVGFQAPLLFGDQGATSLLAYELDRLAPQRVWLVGDTTTAEVPSWSAVERIGGTDQEIADAIAALIEADENLALLNGWHRYGGGGGRSHAHRKSTHPTARRCDGATARHRRRHRGRDRRVGDAVARRHRRT